MSRKVYQKKRSGNGRIVAIFVLVLFCIAFVTTWAIGSEGFAQNNPAKFFNGWGKGEIVNEDELEAQKNRFILSSDDNPDNPTKLIILPAGDRQIDEELPENPAQTANCKLAYPMATTGSVAPTREYATVTTYVLQVVTEPAETEDVFVWRCTNTAAISVDVAADTRSATVKCNAAFGEPVTISVTSNVNENVTASIKADYLKRVVALEYALDPGEITFSNTGAVEHNLSFTPVFGVGTLEPEIRLSSNNNYIMPNFECDVNNINVGMFSFQSSKFNISDPYTAFGGYYGDSWASESEIAGWIKAFKEKVTGTTADATMHFLVEYIYGGKGYGSCQFEVPIAFNVASLHTYAANLNVTTPDGGSVIF